MSEFTIPQTTIDILNSRSEGEVRDYIQEQSSKLGVDHPAINAVVGYADNRFGTFGTSGYLEPADNIYQRRYDATQNILSGQFIRDIDAQLKEENILPFIRPETTGGFMPQMPMGGSPMSMKNPGYGVERNKRIKRDLLNNLSQALAIDESQIDIESGLGDPINRSLLSFQEDAQGKFDFLVDQYGFDNVKRFSIGNKPSFLVKKEGREVLVDEQGAAFGDVLDLVRPGLVLGAEIGVGFFAPQAVVPRLATKLPVLTRAVSAGVGATGGELASEVIEAGPFRSETIGEVTKNIEGLQSLQRGGIAGAFDFGFGKTFALGAKVFTPPGVRGADISQEDFLRVLTRMQERTGIDIVDKTTPAMRSGTRATEMESDVVGKLQRQGVSDDMQPLLVQRRQDFNNSLNLIIKKLKGEEVDFSELSRLGREHFEALEQAAKDAATDARDFAAYATALHFRQLGEAVLSKVNRKTSRQLGKELEDTVSNVVNFNKSQVDSLYDEALSMGDNIPNIDMLSAARRLINVDALVDELPGGAYGQIIRAFIPKNVLRQLSKSDKLSEQAKTRLRQIAEFEENQALFQQGDQKLFLGLLDDVAEMADPGEPLTLSFRNLVNLKKQIGQVYGQAARGDFLEKKQLRNMINSIDGLLESMARESGSDAFDVLKNANNLWKKTRLPLLEDRTIQNVLGNTKRKLGPSQVTESLLNKKGDEVQSLVALMRASPDPRAFRNQIRKSAVNSLFTATENADGMIDLGKLNKMLANNDLIDEFFDKSTVMSLRAIVRLSSGRGKNLLNLPTNPTVTPQTLEKLLAPDAPLDLANKNVLFNKLRDEQKLSKRIKAIELNEASVRLREGGGTNITNTNSTVNTLLKLKSAKQVETFMNSLDEEGKNAVRALVRQRIFDGAIPDSQGARLGAEFGGARLPDADAPIFKSLRDEKDTPFEVAVEILGRDGIQDVLDLVTVLDRVGRDFAQQTTGLLKGAQGQLITRGGQAQSPFTPRIISTLNLDTPYTKLLGIAMTSEKFLNLVGTGQPADITLAILPAIFASDNAFLTFTQLAAEDPSLISSIDQLVSAIDVENSDLLK
jgi:hypothetical protein